MEHQTMILALAMITIAGPVAGVTYSQCQLATILLNNGFDKSLINDCKCSILLSILNEGNYFAFKGKSFSAEEFL
jgi:hypothetical protein